MRKELPLKHSKEPKLISCSGRDAEVFEIESKERKKYIYKEMKEEGGIIMWYPGGTHEEKAANMRRVFDVLKKHLGNIIADTNYIVAKNKQGEKCIMQIQEKIEGARLSDLYVGDPQRRRAEGQLQIARKASGGIIEEIENDPRFRDIKIKNLIGDIEPWNTILGKDGNIKIIDW